ncbi:unnamed protein product, partial [Rotaria socialis]
HSQRPLLNKTQDERVNRRLLMSSDDNSISMEMHDISGYQEAPLLSLEQACNKLHIENLSNYIAKAKNMSRRSRNGLTQDEQAAIHLYTQETPLYLLLNTALRQVHGCDLTSWYAYLKLFIIALQKLSPYRGTVWRGVPRDLSAKYEKSDVKTWWGFSSCTSSLDILTSSSFLGSTGVRTLFNIEIFNGREISEFSDHCSEKEILLLPGTCVRVVGQMKQSDGLQIVHLKQIEAPHFLLENHIRAKPIRQITEKYSQNRKTAYNDSPEEEYGYEQKYFAAQGTATAKPPPTFYAQLELANNISSDEEKAKLLQHLLCINNLSDKMLADIVECIITIYSDQEKYELLQLVLKRSSLSNKQLETTVELIHDIRSDNYKANSLKTLLSREQFIAQHFSIIIEATEEIYSDGDKSNFYKDLMNSRYLQLVDYCMLLYAIKNINNDASKRELLCKLAPKLPKTNPKISRAYIDAADSIYSSQDKATATLAFQ